MIKDETTKHQGQMHQKETKKCDEVAKLYDKIQIAYADILDNDKSIQKIMCNVLLEDLPEGEFASDFVCIKEDGDYMVRECVFKKKLNLPRTCKLLDASHLYWAKRGVTDWGLIVEKEQGNEEE